MIRDELARLLRTRIKNRPFILYVGKDAIWPIKDGLGGCVRGTEIFDMQEIIQMGKTCTMILYICTKHSLDIAERLDLSKLKAILLEGNKDQTVP